MKTNGKQAADAVPDAVPDYDAVLSETIVAVQALAQQLERTQHAARGVLAPAGVGSARALQRAVDAALERWRSEVPVLMGLPPKETPRETALRECRRDLPKARERLKWAQGLGAYSVRPEDQKRLVDLWDGNVKYLERRLAALEGRAVPDDEPTAGQFLDALFSLGTYAKARAAFGLPADENAEKRAVPPMP